MRLALPPLPRARHPRRYGLRDLYEAVVLLPPAVALLAGNRRGRLVHRVEIERVMLAVTAVNGCAACSWAHTRMALRKGMPPEEISSLLAGSGELLPPAEAAGVAFAQHYADSRCRPDPGTYATLEQLDGPDRARVVLAAAQVMMVGNLYGLPLSAVLARRQATPDEDSSVGDELGLLAAGALAFPVALAHGLLRWAAGRPVARFRAAAAEP
jgi:AhpD family alkylhydroperoxidase